MASHFPSIEELDPTLDNQLDTGGSDANLDFLKREQEALGELFENDTSTFPDLLDSGDVPDTSATAQFEKSFPALDDTQNPAGVMGSTLPYMPSFAASTSHTPQPAVQPEEEEEPDVIREWRERTALRIIHQDEQSERKKRETTEKAQRAIDDFYENYNVKKDKLIAQTRQEAEEFLANRENTSFGGTTWERIAKLVDLGEKGTRTGKSDKTRFRELLLSLKKDENAPGAKVSVS
ncbi:clathrin light chain [Kalaharituber pfeilii]|nr:clathrin light chain [Kalaharituber pfeilii]